MQTAVEFLEKICNDRGYHLMEEYFEQAKEMEKQQIIDSFWNGDNTDCTSEQNSKEFAEKYYNETYGSKGSDENFKQFSLYEHKETITSADTITSSQTEISDEEIEKEADKYSDAYDCPSKIKLCKHDIKAAFINSIGWYREQLKKKQ